MKSFELYDYQKRHLADRVSISSEARDAILNNKHVPSPAPKKKNATRQLTAVRSAHVIVLV